jgi:nitrogen regulatory protein PII
MQTVKKLEIITNSLEMNRVLELLEKLGISGYSVIKDVSGFGARGRVIDDLENGAFSNDYVLSVCTAEQEQAVVEAIRPILKKYGGICLVSDAKWIVHW